MTIMEPAHFPTFDEIVIQPSKIPPRLFISAMRKTHITLLYFLSTEKTGNSRWMSVCEKAGEIDWNQLGIELRYLADDWSKCIKVSGILQIKIIIFDVQLNPCMAVIKVINFCVSEGKLARGNECSGCCKNEWG